MGTNNPYSPPQSDAEPSIDAATTQLHGVSRSFKWLGWLVTIVYVPIVLTCIGVFVLSLLGFNDESPPFMLFASLFNGAVLTLGISLIRASRRIRNRDTTVRRTALFLSCVLMLGFPLFTIVGVICYRNIGRYLVETDVVST